MESIGGLGEFWGMVVEVVYQNGGSRDLTELEGLWVERPKNQNYLDKFAWDMCKILYFLDNFPLPKQV